MSMASLVAELRKIEALEQRVYAVTVPANAKDRVWPSCVVSRDGGVELGVLGQGEGEKVRVVQIDILDTDYERLDRIMREVEARVDRLSYGLIDPPDDTWNETLGTIQQSIRVSLLP